MQTTLSHVPIMLKGEDIVSFLVEDGAKVRKPFPEAQDRPKEESQKREALPELYYVCGKSLEEIRQNKKALEYVLNNPTEEVVRYSGISEENGIPIFNAIVSDFNDSSRFSQRRFNFAQRIIDYAHHYREVI
jgi:CRISPR/Cas system CSM-associated protein Csm4 (group 5 of RAMP superfamily)